MTDSKSPHDLLPVLQRIAEALDRMSPAPALAIDIDAADAFVWSSAQGVLSPVKKVNRVDIALLHGIDRARE